MAAPNPFNEFENHPNNYQNAYDPRADLRAYRHNIAFREYKPNKHSVSPPRAARAARAANVVRPRSRSRSRGRPVALSAAEFWANVPDPENSWAEPSNSWASPRRAMSPNQRFSMGSPVPSFMQRSASPARPAAPVAPMLNPRARAFVPVGRPAPSSNVKHVSRSRKVRSPGRVRSPGVASRSRSHSRNAPARASPRMSRSRTRSPGAANAQPGARQSLNRKIRRYTNKKNKGNTSK
jgi:hypothetical protein